MHPEEVGLESLADFEASLIDDAPSDEKSPPAAPVPPPAKSKTSGGSSGARDSSGSDKGLQLYERWVGKRLKQFRLMRTMGAGKMGVVFQVEDVNLKRICALKVLRRQVKGPASAQQVDRFLLEARSAAALDHPSIAQVYEINEHVGWWYIAMEFLEGGSLEHLLKSTGPLAPGRAALMLADASRGLAAAHEAGVIHRDVKPANLMLNRLGRCKLVDFGLVKLDSAANPFQKDDQLVVGTPLYVSPEVAQRQGATSASDIYSLGATLYTLVAGTPPFTGRSIREVLRYQIQRPPPDVREKAPQCSASLANLVLRAMSKDPATRPSAEAFAAALQGEVSAALASSSSSGTPCIAAGGATVRIGHSSSGGVGFAAAGTSESGATALRAVATGSSGGRWRGRAWLGLAAVVAALAAGGAWWALRGVGTASTPPGVIDAGHEITNTIGMRLAAVPPGEFVLGSPVTEPGRHQDERRVTVSLTREIYMSVTEVTQRQWAAVMGDDYVPPEGMHPNEAAGRRFMGETLPAYVSWYEAAEFCRRLSLREDQRYRLPTEAEWEYACRAGTTTAFHTGEALDVSQANIHVDVAGGALQPKRRPMAVASFAPNAWGLYDMHGNVMEWCADNKAAYPLGPLKDPQGPDQGQGRVIRGGSWDTYASVARSANRWSNPPALRTDYIGFRVALEPDRPAPRDQASYLATVPEGEPVAMAAAADAPMAAQAVLIELDPALPDYASEVVLEERLRTAGSDTMDRLMRLWEQEFQQWHPQVVIRHEGKGSSTAIPALLEGLSHFGAMSRPLKRAEILEFQSEFGYEPIQLCVAIDALAVYAHPSNPIVQRGLTLAELDAVFSSTRKRGYPNDLLRWGQLLGDGERWSEAPIRAYGRTAVSGTYSVFQEAVLRGGTYRRTNHELVGSAEVVEKVAADPYGIGYSGIGYDRPDVATVPLAVDADGPMIPPAPDAAYDGTYPLARPLFLTVALPPGGALAPLQREFLRFVYSAEGQRLVLQAGFFPLNVELAGREMRQVQLTPASPE